jgi:Tol biopolymer transport system component
MPIGKNIWFSFVGNNNGGTDYWSMNYDGSGKKRLTDFNNPKNRSFKGKVITSADISFSPDGKQLVAYLQTNILTQNGITDIIDLKEDWYK